MATKSGRSRAGRPCARSASAASARAGRSRARARRCRAPAREVEPVEVHGVPVGGVDDAGRGGEGQRVGQEGVEPGGQLVGGQGAGHEVGLAQPGGEEVVAAGLPPGRPGGVVAEEAPGLGAQRGRVRVGAEVVGGGDEQREPERRRGVRAVPHGHPGAGDPRDGEVEHGRGERGGGVGPAGGIGVARVSGRAAGGGEPGGPGPAVGPLERGVRAQVRRLAGDRAGGEGAAEQCAQGVVLVPGGEDLDAEPVHVHARVPVERGVEGGVEVRGRAHVLGPVGEVHQVVGPAGREVGADDRGAGRGADAGGTHASQPRTGLWGSRCRRNVQPHGCR